MLLCWSRRVRSRYCVSTSTQTSLLSVHLKPLFFLLPPPLAPLLFLFIMSRFPSDSTIASPRTTRQTSMSERRPFAPVTPQRTNRSQKARAVSTPLTPSTSSVVSSPFTPITNVYSSVSTFVSPDSSVSTKVEFSPEVLKSKARSVADSTHNWRSRTKENGMLFIGEENSTGE